MKFLILNTDYPEFLRWLYARYPGLENKPHDEQMRVRNESLFGVADFYFSNLRKLGHRAQGKEHGAERYWILDARSEITDHETADHWPLSTVNRNLSTADCGSSDIG